MNMIFLGEAARDSGSFGFSEAWPLGFYQLLRPIIFDASLPSSPDCMYVHTFSNINN